jgi:KTSC domain
MPTFPNSTAIASAEYDATTGQLMIRFRDGATCYTYFSVPLAVYEGLLAARSKGRYVDLCIKPFYSCR